MLRRCSSPSTRARPGRRASSSTTSSGRWVAGIARSDSTTRGPAGSSTTRTRSGRACSPRPVTRLRRRASLSHDLAAVGITNQRETTVVWERATGRPLQRAIVWQDRRTAARSRELPRDLIRARTGLVPDPYFSATKLEWILQRCQRSQRDLAFGTVDSWLVWKLTGGRRACHRRDECVADAPVRTGRSRLGRRAACALRRRAGVAAADRPFEWCHRERQRCSAQPFRSRASPATSRRRSSDRGASSPVRPRQPTAPAASCSSTSGARQRSRPRAFFERRRRLRRESHRSSRSRGRCSSQAPRFSGSAMGWASSRMHGRRRSSRHRSTRPRA